MSLIADAFQPQIVRSLFDLSGHPSVRHISDVITGAPRSGYDLDVDPHTKQITIDFRERTFIGEAVGGDAARLAMACFTSMKKIEDAIADPDSISWALIRLYYASFYGSHSVLRILGHSCTYFDSRHTSHLKLLLEARGNPISSDLPSGLYSCSLNAGQTGFGMCQAGGRVGSPHQTFWQIFDAFLSSSTDTLLAPPTDDARGRHLSSTHARDVFSKLEAFRRILRRGAGASWLSSIRNDIQYKHGLGVWRPLQLNRTERSLILRLSQQWTRDPMKIEVDSPPTGDLPAFVLACAFTTSMCRVLLERIKEKSSNPTRSFAKIPLQIYK
jgi:hypothetical protein